MKKISGILFFTLLSFFGNAQIKKNTYLLGGELSYINETYSFVNFTDQKRAGGTIGISIGKAFKENFVIGLNLNFSPLKESNFFTGNDTVTTRYYRSNLGVFLREYKKLAKDFYFFGQIDGAVIINNQTGSYKVAAADVKVIQRGAFISITPGISYHVFKKLQLEITIPNMMNTQYWVTKVVSHHPEIKNSKIQQFSFDSNLSSTTSLGWLGLGFRFLL
jgi:hypothetical protein